MNQEESKKAFEDLLKIKGYTYRYLYNENGEMLMIDTDGHVDLEDINFLPSHVCFQNRGYVDLSSIEILPEYIVFKNDGNIYLKSLKEFSKGLRFRNGKDLTETGIKLRIKFGMRISHLINSLEIEGISPKKILNCFIKQIYG
jgi:hypothetical protein